ncbi:hypothetical protein Bbelb_019230 [Branchiostoma belcheri]|nr:hypothetical protein Bbelb_019230 [Branchiostoma belcheri]
MLSVATYVTDSIRRYHSRYDRPTASPVRRSIGKLFAALLYGCDHILCPGILGILGDACARACINNLAKCLCPHLSLHLSQHLSGSHLGELIRVYKHPAVLAKNLVKTVFEEEEMRKRDQWTDCFTCSDLAFYIRKGQSLAPGAADIEDADELKKQQAQALRERKAELRYDLVDNLFQIQAEVKAKAKDDVFKSAHAIVQETMLANVDDTAPNPELPRISNLMRMANRSRKTLRRKDPTSLDFAMNPDHIPPGFIRADVCTTA